MRASCRVKGPLSGRKTDQPAQPLGYSRDVKSKGRDEHPGRSLFVAHLQGNPSPTTNHGPHHRGLSRQDGRGCRLKPSIAAPRCPAGPTYRGFLFRGRWGSVPEGHPAAPMRRPIQPALPLCMARPLDALQPGHARAHHCGPSPAALHAPSLPTAKAAAWPHRRMPSTRSCSQPPPRSPRPGRPRCPARSGFKRHRRAGLSRNPSRQLCRRP